MQLGFVIDHSRCIGCHACTVACKSENEVPVGSFRTWVKYTETGEFPTVRRSFAVLRCNQCTDAPCVTICPVGALEKRADGIVDVDPAACIGCKSCMQGCPYDALYINEDSGTAQKCHFCAHRVERGLAPACAVVCPTEAIVPGDFDDPESRVSRLAAEHDLAVRKPEAGTSPNVRYRDAAPAGLDPLATRAPGGYLFADRHRESLAMDRDLERAVEERAQARTTYDIDRRPLWGGKITGYLFFKSLSAGIAMWAASFWGAGLTGLSAETAGPAALILAVASVVFLGITGALLVADLKRPERFFFLLTRPQWNSWLARGSLALAGFGLAQAIWVALLLSGSAPGGVAGVVCSVVIAALAALTACYTAWLFAQARGRVLWMRRHLALHLLVQALVGGGAFMTVVLPLVPMAAAGVLELRAGLIWSLVAHLLFVLAEPVLSPRGREPEYAQVSRLVSHGRLARPHWRIGVALGIVVPIAILTLLPGLAVLAGLLALVGLWVEEDVFVRAGQATRIS